MAALTTIVMNRASSVLINTMYSIYDWLEPSSPLLHRLFSNSFTHFPPQQPEQPYGSQNGNDEVKYSRKTQL